MKKQIKMFDNAFKPRNNYAGTDMVYVNNSTYHFKFVIQYIKHTFVKFIN